MTGKQFMDKLGWPLVILLVLAATIGLVRCDVQHALRDPQFDSPPVDVP